MAGSDLLRMAVDADSLRIPFTLTREHSTYWLQTRTGAVSGAVERGSSTLSPDAEVPKRKAQVDGSGAAGRGSSLGENRVEGVTKKRICEGKWNAIKAEHEFRCFVFPPLDQVEYTRFLPYIFFEGASRGHPHFHSSKTKSQPFD